jgi:hypothetical protein
MPLRATTSERVWSFQALARSPRTASMFAPGVRFSSFGVPNGVSDGLSID